MNLTPLTIDVGVEVTSVTEWVAASVAISEEEGVNSNNNIILIHFMDQPKHSIADLTELLIAYT